MLTRLFSLCSRFTELKKNQNGVRLLKAAPCMTMLNPCTIVKTNLVNKGTKCLFNTRLVVTTVQVPQGLKEPLRAEEITKRVEEEHAEEPIRQ